MNHIYTFGAGIAGVCLTYAFGAGQTVGQLTRIYMRGGVSVWAI